ncbi:MAG: OmpA family protein [Bacteroidota bacterium]
MIKIKSIFLLFLIAAASSCVPKKKLVESQTRFADLQSRSDNQIRELKSELTDTEKQGLELRAELKGKQVELVNTNNQVKLLQEQIDYLKKTNTNLLDRLSELSVVNKTGAENMKRTLDALNEQSRYIKDLTSSVQRKDSLNLALVMNLKNSLSNIQSSDVNVEVKKGLVYISISDQLLFNTASSTINAQAEEVLGKVAKVLNEHAELDLIVEGHTDNIPIVNENIIDNWDLSAKRAIAVVRLLQNKFAIAPQRMIAGGRSEYQPKASNDTDLGKAQNRRTEIIVTPKLDQFFQLLDKQK